MTRHLSLALPCSFQILFSIKFSSECVVDPSDLIQANHVNNLKRKKNSPKPSTEFCTYIVAGVRHGHEQRKYRQTNVEAVTMITEAV